MHALPAAITPSGTGRAADVLRSSETSAGSSATLAATQERASSGIGTYGARTPSRSDTAATSADCSGGAVIVVVGRSGTVDDVADARAAVVVVAAERLGPVSPCGPLEHPASTNEANPSQYHRTIRPLRRSPASPPMGIGGTGEPTHVRFAVRTICSTSSTPSISRSIDVATRVATGEASG